MRTFPKSVLRAIKKDSVAKFQEAMKPHHLTKPDQAGMWLIHHAAEFGSLNILKHLHALGVSLEKRTSKRIKSRHWGYTALYVAVDAGQLATADWLISMGASFKPQKLLDIPLTWGNLATVKWAIEQGGQLDYSDNPQKNSLYIAIKYNRADVITWLIEEQNFTASAEFIVPALSWVSFKTIRWLIDKNIIIPPDILLDKALERGDVQDVQWSIERGALLNGDHFSQKNSLLIAIEKNNLAVAQWLVDRYHHVNINVLRSAFHRHMSLDMFKWLVDTIKLPLKTILQSDHPLLSAVNRNSPALFDWLHKEKKISLEEDNNHTNLLLSAIEQDHLLIAKHIVDNNYISLDSFSNPHLNPILIASQKSRSCLRWLVKEKKQSLDVIDNGGRGPIIKALTGGHFKNLRYLHRKGLSLNVKSANGTHPIHYAAILDDVRILSWLVKKGCRVDEANNANENILHFNLQFYGEYHNFNVTRWLIEKHDILSIKIFRLTLLELPDPALTDYYPAVVEKIIEHHEMPEYIAIIIRHLQQANCNWRLSNFYEYEITINDHAQYLMSHNQAKSAAELLHRIIQDPIISDTFKLTAKINMAEILLLGVIYLSEDDSPLAITDPWLTQHDFYYLRMIQIKYLLKDVTHADAAVMKEKVDCVLLKESPAQRNVLSEPDYSEKSEEYYLAYLAFKTTSLITRFKICEIAANSTQNNAPSSFAKSLMFWQEKNGSTPDKKSPSILTISPAHKINKLQTFWQNPTSAAPLPASEEERENVISLQ